LGTSHAGVAGNLSILAEGELHHELGNESQEQCWGDHEEIKGIKHHHRELLFFCRDLIKAKKGLIFKTRRQRG
jgi:hypothetical protein